jgi:pilus assembly protein Flp/PilA
LPKKIVQNTQLSGSAVEEPVDWPDPGQALVRSGNRKDDCMLTFLIAWLQIRLRRDDRGATAVEYALLIAGIAALIATAVFLLGPAISTVFTNIKDKISGA